MSWRIRGGVLAAAAAAALGILTLSGMALAGMRTAQGGGGQDSCYPADTYTEYRDGVLYECTLWFCPPSTAFWECIPA